MELAVLLALSELINHIHHKLLFRKKITLSIFSGLSQGSKEVCLV